mmetsp:Transcript_24862/g.47639  ORF Transcript_24862/g.47639 Transcript_24862/m.47639 type:complete len:161 (-) Transcript_24862:135-617(-)|eukprot:CAMPEP_0201602962 /NCGR_PEP_ID=MMETSP0492-20130828/3554_1 /ASSEMBLY_ACC=CAM_ASM_000837 /TAXON_ID=420259 /ORGANISM="Thalassiosira gravida, Strain GMp14c1" /LENGTH=160 /DNA_ID=CAMNT_0048066637 /DNA_START=98 /DNA_END=580 /DNA_ORIENTATION=-
MSLSDTSKMQHQSSRKLRGKMLLSVSASTSPKLRSILLGLALFLSPFLLLNTQHLNIPLSVLHVFPVVEAKEIIATHEWQLLSDNDTVPAGLHIRMDLSTGQKWAKIASNEKRDDSIKAVVHDSKKINNLSKVETVEVDARSGDMSVVGTSGAKVNDSDK